MLKAPMSSALDLADAVDAECLAEALRPSLLRVSRRLRQEASRAGLSALDALRQSLVAAEAANAVR